MIFRLLFFCIGEVIYGLQLDEMLIFRLWLDGAKYTLSSQLKLGLRYQSNF